MCARLEGLHALSFSSNSVVRLWKAISAVPLPAAVKLCWRCKVQRLPCTLILQLQITSVPVWPDGTEHRRYRRVPGPLSAAPTTVDRASRGCPAEGSAEQAGTTPRRLGLQLRARRLASLAGAGPSRGGRMEEGRAGSSVSGAGPLGPRDSKGLEEKQSLSASESHYIQIFILGAIP